MDLKPYIRPILKWWWMLVLAGLLAGASSLFFSLRQPPIYQAHTTLMIGQTINDPNPAQNLFYLEQQLAGIYANMAMRQPIRDATMKALELTWLPQYNVYADTNTQLIEIWVEDTNPVRAQAVAAELAHQLILRSPTTNKTDDTSRQEFIQGQLDDLQKQIKTTQDTIEKLNTELGSLNSARQISEKQNEIATLENKLSILQSNFANLLGNSDSGAPNSLTIVEPAEVPSAPVGPNRALNVIMSTLIGVGLAAVGAYAIEFLDPTFRSPQEVKRAMQVPILGEIPSLPKDCDVLHYVDQNPLSPIADSFRLVKNSLEVVGLGSSLRYLQIISSEALDGKTTLAVNLAITIAKSGKRVLLVDMDLRKTTLTQNLNMQDHRGLSNVFLGEGELSSVITLTEVNNLRILPAGTRLSDTSNWFTSSTMQSLISELENYADVIVLDGTPAIVPDAMELARRIMKVIFVVRLNNSRRDLVKNVKEQFDLVNVEVVGVILNDVPLKETYYGGYGKYGYSSYAKSPGAPGKNNHHKSAGAKTTLGGFLRDRFRVKATKKEKI
jgi:capsular exopolysaccharide synthesis family protein